MTTELETPGFQPFCTAAYAARAVSNRPVSPPSLGTIRPMPACSSGRWVATELIGTFSFHGRLPTMLVENVQLPTDQRPSSRARPCWAVRWVTSARVRPPAVGTLAFIDPDTSNTASIRPGWVMAVQLPSSGVSAAAPGAGGGGTLAGAPGRAGKPA